MDHYTALKKQAVDVAGKCIELSDSCDCAESSSALKKVKRALADNKLVIMAVGEARTGKSSLLGAYLDDRELFPVDVDVTTCLITMVVYGEQEKVTVALSSQEEDGEVRVITRDEIPAYAKEQENPSGQKQAMMILVETPNEVLKDGTIFVDSPGIGSLNPMHSRITYQFLPRADLLLFVTDATAQISTSELQFLKSVYTSCKNILFVMTKKDLQYDCSELIEQNRRAISRQIGLPPEEQVHIPVSSSLLAAYRQTNDAAFLEESNFAALDRAISTMIFAKRPQVTLLPRLMEVGQELEKIGQAIEVEETACSSDSSAVDALGERLEKLEESRQYLLDNSTDWTKILNDRILDMEAALTGMMDEYSVQAAQYIDACLEKKEYQKNPDQLKNEVVAMTEQKIQEMQVYTADTLDKIQYDIETASGLSLEASERQFAPTAGSSGSVTFVKNSFYQQVMQTGQTIRRHSFVLNTVGGVVGGVAGGVAGFALGGPWGAVTGATLGTSAGKELGGLLGTGKGVVDVAVHGVGYDIEAVRKQLKRYVSGRTQDWNRAKQSFTRAVTSDLKLSIQKKIKLSLSELRAQRQALSKRSKAAGAELAAYQKRTKKLRASYDQLSAQLEAVMKKCMMPIPALDAGQEDGRHSKEGSC